MAWIIALLMLMTTPVYAITVADCNANHNAGWCYDIQCKNVSGTLVQTATKPSDCCSSLVPITPLELKHMKEEEQAKVEKDCP